MNVRNNTSYKEASDVNSRNFAVALPARNWQRIPQNHGLHVLILRCHCHLEIKWYGILWSCHERDEYLLLLLILS